MGTSPPNHSMCFKSHPNDNKPNRRFIPTVINCLSRLFLFFFHINFILLCFSIPNFFNDHNLLILTPWLLKNPLSTHPSAAALSLHAPPPQGNFRYYLYSLRQSYLYSYQYNYNHKCQHNGRSSSSSSVIWRLREPICGRPLRRGEETERTIDGFAPGG